MSELRITWEQMTEIARDWLSPKPVLAVTLVRVLGPLSREPIAELNAGRTPRFIVQRKDP